ncbi:MAG: hypothetical protein KCHDKBKB_02063 [Elusimicrobia bacterium]|nr:hypothetical protein [Elusimicrobiota bacterium]
MRRSEPKQKTIPPVRRSEWTRPVLFKVLPVRHIYRKDPFYVRWFPGLIFFLVFVLTLVVLTHASPPQSRGARAIALGNGYSAVSGDVYSLFYNPAGLYEINQKEIAFDYGRSFSIGESARSDFNGVYSVPTRFKDKNYPLTMGIYGEVPAKGAHIVDVTVGTAGDAPLERWTRGILKFSAKGGLAVTLRQQHGDDLSDRVGESSLGLGLTGGLIFPVNRKLQSGLALRQLFNPDANPAGPSLITGIFYKYTPTLHMLLDLEYASGGLWRIHPGLEWLLARGVVRPRLGWGYRDTDGVDTLATGVGIYVSPIQLDIAHLIPLRNATDNTGQFRASLSYRFGRPQFSEIYYDRALEQASQLDQNVLMMTSKEAELKASLAELEQKKRLAKEELENAKSRIEQLKNKDLLGERDAVIRDLKARVRELEGHLSAERGTLKAIRQKQNSIRTHKVSAGETLQSIAREYYGDASQWKKIYSANPDKIDRGLPKVGSTLVIP